MFNMTICGHKKGVSGTKHFLIGSIAWNKVISCSISPVFTMFLYTCNVDQN